MDSRLIEAFLSVVQNQSYSQAAKQLGLPKSTVSRHVAELEHELGVRLLHRTTRRLNVTTAGQSLYERLEPLMKSLSLALTEMPEREGGVSGTLKVTASVDFGISVLAPVVSEFLSEFPNVEVDLRLTNEYVDLVREGLDVAVRMASRRLRDSTLQAKKIGQLHLCLVASKTYLSQTGAIRSPRDLEDQQWVRFRGMGPVRLEGPTGTIRFEPKGRLTVDDMLAAREAVKAGAGLGLLPAMTLQGEFERQELIRVLPKWEPPSSDAWLLWPTSSYVPRKVTAFAEFLTSRLKSGNLMG